MIIGNKQFDTKNNTYIFGILNVTPDSFSDGGKYTGVDKALFQVEKMIGEGMDIVDIGGESTRPGYQMISCEEEISRIIPVITAVKKRFDIPISVDTYKSEVAKAALDAGTDLINDIWGFLYDEKMAEVVKKYNAACCLMHNRKDTLYNDFVVDVVNDLKKCIKTAKDAGIDDDKIILDPGVGFAKDLVQNLTITNHMDALNELGYPVLLGTSRKSMIGNTLNVPISQREEGTLVTTVLAVQKKISFVRVHDVLSNARAIKMTKAILTDGKSLGE